jgi:hypothetical protein
MWILQCSKYTCRSTISSSSSAAASASSSSSYSCTAQVGPWPPLSFFLNNNRFTGWIFGPAPNPLPPTWRTRSPYLWPPETGWPSCTPRHWVPILVAFYGMHGLQWDYSLIPATTRKEVRFKLLKWQLNTKFFPQNIKRSIQEWKLY